jgi:uncharacterized protein
VLQIGYFEPKLAPYPMRANYAMLFAIVMILLGSCARPAYRVLVITGGHDFEHAAFFTIFDSLGVDYLEVQHPEANDWYGRDDIASFDAVVFYDMVQEIDEKQKKDFMALTEKGVGLVFLHHSLVSYQHWDDFMQVLGGRYYLEPYEENGVEIPASGYEHEQLLQISVADPDHPVTLGVAGFEIADEVYSGYRVLPDVHTLLLTDHPLSTPEVGWAHRYGKSRVVYLQSGHDRLAYANPQYQKLIGNAIQWVSAR